MAETEAQRQARLEPYIIQYQIDLQKQIEKGNGPHVLTEQHRQLNQKVYSALIAKNMIPLADCNKTNDADLIMRFLIARKFDVEKVIANIERYIEWRKAEKIDDVLWDKLDDELAIIGPEYRGFAKENNYPVGWQQPCPAKISALLDNEKYTIDVIMRRNWQALETSRRLMLAVGTDRMVQCLDLSSLGLSILGRPQVISLLKEMSARAQGLYPELMRSMYITNGGLLFSMAWKGVRPMLDERVQKKVVDCGSGSDISEILKEYIPIEQIPQSMGGRAPDVVLTHECILECMEGRVPPGTPPMRLEGYRGDLPPSATASLSSVSKDSFSSRRRPSSRSPSKAASAARADDMSQRSKNEQSNDNFNRDDGDGDDDEEEADVDDDGGRNESDLESCESGDLDDADIVVRHEGKPAAASSSSAAATDPNRPSAIAARYVDSDSEEAGRSRTNQRQQKQAAEEEGVVIHLISPARRAAALDRRRQQQQVGSDYNHHHHHHSNNNSSSNGNSPGAVPPLPSVPSGSSSAAALFSSMMFKQQPKCVHLFIRLKNHSAFYEPRITSRLDYKQQNHQHMMLSSLSSSSASVSAAATAAGAAALAALEKGGNFYVIGGKVLQQQKVASAPRMIPLTPGMFGGAAVSGSEDVSTAAGAVAALLAPAVGSPLVCVPSPTTTSICVAQMHAESAQSLRKHILIVDAQRRVHFILQRAALHNEVRVLRPATDLLPEVEEVKGLRFKGPAERKIVARIIALSAAAAATTAPTADNNNPVFSGTLSSTSSSAAAAAAAVAASSVAPPTSSRGGWVAIRAESDKKEEEGGGSVSTHHHHHHHQNSGDEEQVVLARCVEVPSITPENKAAIAELFQVPKDSHKFERGVLQRRNGVVAFHRHAVFYQEFLSSPVPVLAALTAAVDALFLESS